MLQLDAVKVSADDALVEDELDSSQLLQSRLSIGQYEKAFDGHRFY